MLKQARQAAISLFVVTTLLTVVFLNRPDAMLDREAAWQKRQPAPWALGPARALERLLLRYADLVGLDNRWRLFSYLHRFDWWYVIVARSPDGSERPLPLPRQSQRSFLAAHFFDHKNNKLLHNLYNRPGEMRRYAQILCASYATERAPIESITFQVYFQGFLPRYEARRRGGHLEPSIQPGTAARFPCQGRRP